jgi:hypothetical protein
LRGIAVHCFEALHYDPLSNAEVGGECLEKARCTNSLFEKQGYVNAIMDPPSSPNMTTFLAMNHLHSNWASDTASWR